MNRQAYTYVVVVSAAAIALVLLLPWDGLYALGLHHGLGLAMFTAVAVLSEGLAVDFSVAQNRTAKSSIGFLPLFASAIIFPPIAAVAATLLVHGFTELVLRERVYWRAAFNTAQHSISIGLGALVYDLAGRPPWGSLAIVVAFCGLALTAFLVNSLLVSGFYAVRQKQSFFHITRKIFAGGGGIHYGLLASPIALVAAILYDSFYIGGLLMLILPLMLIRYSYLSKVQLQQANRDLLRALVKAIETRDPYTSGHSLRVSSLARAIAEDLGLPRKKVEQVETAALLHDIGKIDMVYAPLIRKPGELTPEERAVIQSHATRGAELLRSLSSVDEEVIRAVRHHHERYDGSGYPDGLAGKAIPIAARIIMLSDAIDAMLSNRPYRGALTIEQARLELLRCSGTQFDPDIVEAILKSNTLERVGASRIPLDDTSNVPSAQLA